jgi:NADPH:quinone reductase-like Zn-dependent oxidoreductase
MRAAAIEAFGGPGALLIHSLPVPVPAAGEVLIATNTAVGARIRRFSVEDAVYAAGFPNPLEGGGHQRWGWSSGFYAECDAVLALAGGPALTRRLEALRPGGRLAYPNGAVEPAPKTRRVVHGAWEANLFISNVLDKPQPESGWPRGTDPCRDAHHSPGDLGEGNGDQNFHPRGSR